MRLPIELRCAQPVQGGCLSPADRPDNLPTQSTSCCRAVRSPTVFGGQGLQAGQVLLTASSCEPAEQKGAWLTPCPGAQGVTKHRRSGRWEAHVWVREDGKQAYLGGWGYPCLLCFIDTALGPTLASNSPEEGINMPAYLTIA